MILFWTPISQRSGFGHFYRLFGIYEKLKKLKYDICYFTNEENFLSPEKDVIIRNFNSLNIEEISIYFKNIGVKVIIIDYYNISLKDIEYLKKDFKIVYFDYDFLNLDVDVIINFNPFSINKYPIKNTNTKYFLGLEYFLHREKVFQIKDKPFEKNNIFICIGGTDIKKVTFDLIKYLPKEFKYTIVLGFGCNKEYINDIKKQLKVYKIKNNLHIQPDDFFQLMNNCEFAITSCSTIVYELSFFEKPFTCINVISNQDQLESFLRDQKITVLRKDDIHNIKNIILNKQFNILDSNIGNRFKELIDKIKDLYNA